MAKLSLGLVCASFLLMLPVSGAVSNANAGNYTADLSGGFLWLGLAACTALCGGVACLQAWFRGVNGRGSGMALSAILLQLVLVVLVGPALMKARLKQSVILSS